MFFRGNFPKLFDTDTVGLLTSTVTSQIKTIHKLFGRVSVTTFCENGDFGVQFHSTFKCVLGRAILMDANIRRRNSFDTSIFVIQHLTCSKSRVDFNLVLLCLLPQPVNEMTETYNVVSVVVVW